MTAGDELASILARLRAGYDVLPFLEQHIPAAEAEFRRMPDDMVDLIASSSDFTPPERGGEPVWLQLEAEGGGQGVIIVARPASDGELWVIAPPRRQH